MLAVSAEVATGSQRPVVAPEKRFFDCPNGCDCLNVVLANGVEVIFLDHEDLSEVSGLGGQAAWL